MTHRRLFNAMTSLLIEILGETAVGRAGLAPFRAVHGRLGGPGWCGDDGRLGHVYGNGGPLGARPAQ